MELMLVLALAAVILALGAPNFGEFRRNARLTSAANELLTATQLARTEAIARHLPVSICLTAEPRAAEPTCGGATFRGWVVFADPDGDCVRVADAEEPILAQAGPVEAAVAARASGDCISFAASGFLRAAGGTASASRVIFCDERGIRPAEGTELSPARGLALQPTGRAQVTRDATDLASWDLACGERP